MAPSATEKRQAMEEGHEQHQLEGEKNEWKFRAPYKVHENNEGFKAYYQGGCHCGRVKYQLGREKPLRSKYCHCTTCQVLHGAPFQWAAIFHKEDINFTHGHHDLGWYESGEKTTRHKLPCKVSCAYCRAPIMDEGRNMILLFPSLIEFKGEREREMFGVDCHMFYEQRLLDIPDGLPKWSGMSEKSELICDSPAEAIKKRKREVEEAEMKENGEKNGKREKNGD
ncbi:hypothetical protein HYFRA_00013363 [Hymenoscyphus fraxineus]|uniref:CENP-V/GFA domain-containing protein n=1 Tax=Hymenoscyphus fraxineus TaxID=746836 RepID=A0A9N9PZG6_9HELO|nr:hypothetical protein HYFRA_00013363 [Hymenoscyphus fraxineus]